MKALSIDIFLFFILLQVSSSREEDPFDSIQKSIEICRESVCKLVIGGKCRVDKDCFIAQKNSIKSAARIILTERRIKLQKIIITSNHDPSFKQLYFDRLALAADECLYQNCFFMFNRGCTLDEDCWLSKRIGILDTLKMICEAEDDMCGNSIW